MVTFTPRELRAVVFDLDNTLLRSTIGSNRGVQEAAKLISSLLKKGGLTYSESSLLRRLQKIRQKSLAGKFLYDRDVWWKTMLAELGAGARFSWIHQVTLRYWDVYAANSPPFRDAERTLRAVRKMGLRIGLVSDSDGTPGMKRKRIRGIPFHRLFESVVVAGEDTSRVKPGSESFRLIAKRLQVEPRSCVYVGDNPRTDITGAKAVGMISIIVKRRHNGGGSPTYRIPRLSALPSLLRSMQQDRK